MYLTDDEPGAKKKKSKLAAAPLKERDNKAAMRDWAEASAEARQKAQAVSEEKDKRDQLQRTEDIRNSADKQ